MSSGAHIIYNGSPVSLGNPLPISIPGGIPASAVGTGYSHSALVNLSADDHTQYALLAGRAGGQTLIGGTGASDNLTLQSTSDVTRGTITLNDQLYAASLTTNSQARFGTLEFQGYSANNTWLSDNVYHNGTNFLYRANGYAQMLRFSGGEIGFFTAASGTTGAIVTLNPRLIMANSGNVGIGQDTPTAILHLGAGSASASSAPLKFASGTLMSTAEAGAVEFLTDKFYGTITTGAARKTFAFLESPTFTGTVTIPTPFTLGAISMTATGTQLNYLSSATGTTGTTSTNIVFSTSPTIATPVITTSATCPLVIGGTGTTDDLILRTTSGVGASGADMIFQTGNNGATEAMRILYDGNIGIGTTAPQKFLHVKHMTAAVGATQVFLEGAQNGYGAGITFQSKIDASTLLEMARITADGEGPWDTTYTNQLAGLRFYTCFQGAVAERLRIYANGNAWFQANVSADSFTDRTPFYEGDALAEIKNIKGIGGKIDHDSLPEFVKVEREITIEPAITKIQKERDLGAMISVLTTGIQQLIKRVEALEAGVN